MDAAFRRCVERAGLDPKRVTPHVTRHTAITRLVKAKIDLSTFSPLGAIRRPPMVLRYTRIHGSHIDDAMQALNLNS